MLRSFCFFVTVFCLAQVLMLPRAEAAPEWVSEEILQMVKADKLRCMAEHGTTEEMINQVNEGTIPNDRAITCYMYCIFEAFGVVDDEANLEADMLIGFLPEHLQPNATKVMSICGEMPGTDVCDRMYNIGKCSKNEQPDLWFLL